MIVKINVAVHIPLFNILSVRQAYCLSIEGVNHCLCPPVLCETHMMAGAAFTQLRMRAPRSALCICAQQKRVVAGHLFIHFHSDQVGLFM